uniref:Eukaryotic translation initiation factor 4E binding protein 1 n=1 Tax=Theropithecus gelada TaxID=9565 RepID=A0A8D2K608_THEGE
MPSPPTRWPSAMLHSYLMTIAPCRVAGGWALFSTTRGGTQIFYDRKFLLDCLNSPMAQTPPCHLPNIPGVSSPGTLIEDSRVEVNNLNNINNHERKHAVGDDAQFEMDI